VYPRPDEFFLAPGRVIGVPTELNPVGLRELGPELRPGYDWLVPSISPEFLMVTRPVSPNGLRWQNLIVSPTRQSWMQPAKVGEEANYAWWKQLREVDCSWICNREESERFLYYDGPTTLRCPVQFAWEKERLVVRPTKFADGERMFTQVSPVQLMDTRRGLLVNVRGGRAEVELVSIPLTSKEAGQNWPTFPVGQKLQVTADEAFLRVVFERGLTQSEGKGMLQCWRKAFFETDGVRLLMFLTSKDYEGFCPLTAKPEPTELARVGVIWAELK
jgi:hypothetical protein